MVSGSEIFVILFFAFLLFGSKRLPEVARGLGKGIKEIKKITSDIKNEIENTDVGKDLKDITDIKKDIDDLKKI